MEYNELLEQRLENYRKRLNADDPIDPREPFLQLDWSKDNRRYFRALITDKISTKKLIDAETARQRARARFIAALGEAPETARDYARIYAKRTGVAITYKGEVRIPSRSQSSILDLTRSARIVAAELDLPFSIQSINDAVEDYFERERDSALDRIRSTVVQPRSFDWEAMARDMFDCSDGVDFVVAVLKSFVWQVLRKLHGLPVPSPLMPVITGAQNKGKSYFVKALIAVMAEIATESDFAAMSDERNIDLWRSYIIFMDEMAKAAKSDVEVIKHVITAQHLERRPMRTNSSITIRQNASFIGTTNASVAELIKDETGNRRFVELKWKIDYREGDIDKYLYRDAWASVSQTDPDPMIGFKDRLKEVQAESRNHGPVEYWLRNLDDEEWGFLSEAADAGFITTKDLYPFYLRHRAAVAPDELSHERRTMPQFAHELARVVSMEAGYCVSKVRTSKANGWRLTPPDTTIPPDPAVLRREERIRALAGTIGGRR